MGRCESCINRRTLYGKGEDSSHNHERRWHWEDEGLECGNYSHPKEEMRFQEELESIHDARVLRCYNTSNHDARITHKSLFFPNNHHGHKE